MSLHQISVRNLKEPERYALTTALADRHGDARVVRIGAMGDPSRARPSEVQGAREEVAKAGLDGVITYTHFWREEGSQWLREIALASCESEEDAVTAIGMGWTPALLLRWDAALEGQRTITLSNGDAILICPAQTKENVTCNTCRMCWTDHPVWRTGKIAGIGFLDHSFSARMERRRWQRGRQLPLFSGIGRPDIRPSHG